MQAIPQNPGKCRILASSNTLLLDRICMVLLTAVTKQLYRNPGLDFVSKVRRKPEGEPGSKETHSLLGETKY